MRAKRWGILDPMSRSSRSQQIIEVLGDAFEALMAADPVAFRGKYRTMASDPHAFFRGTACLYYADNMGVDTVVLRFASTYGPGKTARHGKMGVTSAVVEAPADGRPFRLAQGGDETGVSADAVTLHLGCTGGKGPTVVTGQIGDGPVHTADDDNGYDQFRAAGFFAAAEEAPSILAFDDMLVKDAS